MRLYMLSIVASFAVLALAHFVADGGGDDGLPEAKRELPERPFLAICATAPATPRVPTISVSGLHSGMTAACCFRSTSQSGGMTCRRAGLASTVSNGSRHRFSPRAFSSFTATAIWVPTWR